jgi:phage gpG-like protein
LIRVIANTTELHGMLRRVIGRLEQTEQALRAVGNLIYSLTLGAFDLSIGQRPAAWPPRRDGTPATLYKTGALRHSLRLSVGPQSALVTTDRPYCRPSTSSATSPGRTSSDPGRAKGLPWFSGGQHRSATDFQGPLVRRQAPGSDFLTDGGDAIPPV